MSDGWTFGQLVPDFILKVHRHLDDLDEDLGRDISVKFREFAEKYKKK